MNNDRVENWRRFSAHMEKYIAERTIEKYQVDESKGLDLMSLSNSEICVWNILRYALRMWKGKKKQHDLEKVAHYAEMAWTLNGAKPAADNK